MDHPSSAILVDFSQSLLARWESTFQIAVAGFGDTKLPGGLNVRSSANPPYTLVQICPATIVWLHAGLGLQRISPHRYDSGGEKPSRVAGVIIKSHGVMVISDIDLRCRPIPDSAMTSVHLGSGPWLRNNSFQLQCLALRVRCLGPSPNRELRVQRH